MNEIKTLKEHILNKELWLSNEFDNPLEEILFFDSSRSSHLEVPALYQITTSTEQIKIIRNKIQNNKSMKGQGFLIHYYKGIPIPIGLGLSLDGPINYIHNPVATKEQIRQVDEFAKTDYWQRILNKWKEHV